MVVLESAKAVLVVIPEPIDWRDLNIIVVVIVSGQGALIVKHKLAAVTLSGDVRILFDMPPIMRLVMRLGTAD